MNTLCMHDRINKLMNEWIMDEWKNGWINEWMHEYNN